MILRGLRGLGDIDVSDESVTMGNAGDDAAAAVNAADFAASLFGADVSTSTGLSQSATDFPLAGQNTAAPSSSGFDWGSLVSGAGGILKSIFGGPSTPSSSSAQLAAANAAAQQAAQTRNLLLFGGAAVVIGGAFLLARRKKS